LSAGADFVERFAAYWRAPSAEGLDALLAPDVLLVAPMTPTTRTLAEGKRAFASILALVPDLTAEVHRWGQTGDGVLIEFTLSGTAGGAPVSWDAVDRIVLREDGLASARISYFDTGPLIRAVALRPRAWPAFLRSRLRR
jgi:ketosteroid isomerase-like protein